MAATRKQTSLTCAADKRARPVGCCDSLPRTGEGGLALGSRVLQCGQSAESTDAPTGPLELELGAMVLGDRDAHPGILDASAWSPDRTGDFAAHPGMLDRSAWRPAKPSSATSTAEAAGRCCLRFGCKGCGAGVLCDVEAMGFLSRSHHGRASLRAASQGVSSSSATTSTAGGSCDQPRPRQPAHGWIDRFDRSKRCDPRVDGVE